MVRKYPSSSWKLSSWRTEEAVAKAAVKECYTRAVMADIVSAANLSKITSDPKQWAKLARMIRVGVTNWAIHIKSLDHLTKRPSPAQRRAALKKVQTSAHSLNEIFALLDGDSANDLYLTITADSFFHRVIKNDLAMDESHPLYKRAKYRAFLELIGKIGQWAQTAQSSAAKRKDGDNIADAKRWFVEGMINIWIKIGHKKASITWAGDPPRATGAFMNFVNAAGKPLGLTAMESSVRECISAKRRAKNAP